MAAPSWINDVKRAKVLEFLYQKLCQFVDPAPGPSGAAPGRDADQRWALAKSVEQQILQQARSRADYAQQLIQRLQKLSSEARLRGDGHGGGRGPEAGGVGLLAPLTRVQGPVPEAAGVGPQDGQGVHHTPRRRDQGRAAPPRDLGALEAGAEAHAAELQGAGEVQSTYRVQMYEVHPVPDGAEWRPASSSTGAC